MRYPVIALLLLFLATPAFAEWHVTVAGNEATEFCADDDTMVFVEAQKPRIRIAWPSSVALRWKDSARVTCTVDGKRVHSPRWERRGIQTRVVSLPTVQAMKRGRTMELFVQSGKQTYHTTVSLIGLTRALKNVH